MTHYMALNVYNEILNSFSTFAKSFFWITRQFSFCHPWVHGNVKEFLCKAVISKNLQMKETENVDLILEGSLVF